MYGGKGVKKEMKLDKEKLLEEVEKIQLENVEEVYSKSRESREIGSRLAREKDILVYREYTDLENRVLKLREDV